MEMVQTVFQQVESCTVFYRPLPKHSKYQRKTAATSDRPASLYPSSSQLDR